MSVKPLGNSIEVIDPNFAGRAKIAAYLEGQIQFADLYRWALLFGFDPADSLNSESFDVSEFVISFGYGIELGEVTEAEFISEAQARLQDARSMIGVAEYSRGNQPIRVVHSSGPVQGDAKAVLSSGSTVRRFHWSGLGLALGSAAGA